MSNDYATKKLLPVDINEFDVSKLSFEQSKLQPGRTPTIYLKYGADKKDFQLLLDYSEIRLMSLPNKVGELEYTITQAMKGVDKFAMERSGETTPSAVLYNKMLDLEECVIQTAVKHSTDWFGKKRSEETIRDSFARIIKCSTDKGSKTPNGKYDPSIRVKVKVYDQAKPDGTKKKIVHLTKPGVSDADGNPVVVVPDAIPTIFKNNMQAILGISGKVYTQQGGAFGVSWTLETAQIFPEKENDDSADSLFKNKKKPVSTRVTETEPEEEQEAEQEVELTQIEEEEDSPAPAPAPVPAPARKKRGPVAQNV